MALHKKEVKFLIRKYKALIKARLQKKRHGFAKYSVISPCYNVEKYLDDFISSVVNQRLSFKDNIELILVNNGCTDSSPEILDKWHRRYPDNIKIVTIEKNGGGPAPARNLGLKYATNDWVIFSDPDDFFSYDAFYEVDKALGSEWNDDICIVTMKVNVFLEQEYRIIENNLKRFQFETSLVRVRDFNEDYVQNASNSSLIRRECILKAGAFFPEKCRPVYEDGYFVNMMYANLHDKLNMFLSKPKYFYRIRADQSSSCDGALSRREFYTDVFEHGVFPLLRDAQALRHPLPSYVQNSVICECSSRFNYLVGHDEVTDFLSVDDKAKYLDNLTRAYKACDRDTIMRFYSFGGGRDLLLYKVGILGRFRQEKPTYQLLYVTDYDPYHDEVLVRYYRYFTDDAEVFSIDNDAVIPSYRKTIDLNLVGERFVSVCTLWLPLNGANEDAKFSCKLDGIDTKISLNGTELESISLNDIRIAFRHEFIDEKSPYAHAWLIYSQNESNVSEHFYQWMHEHHPEIKCFMVADKHSVKWAELKQQGFNLIAHHSKDHKYALKAADNVVITASDRHTFDYYWGNKPGRNKPRLVYLHAPNSADDPLTWVDTIRLDLFFGNADDAHSAIADKFTDKEFKVIDWHAEGASSVSSDVKNSSSECEVIFKHITKMRAW